MTASRALMTSPKPVPPAWCSASPVPAGASAAKAGATPRILPAALPDLPAELRRPLPLHDARRYGRLDDQDQPRRAQTEDELDTLQYGVWDDQVYDCRNGQDATPLPVSGLEQFAPDNPVRVFVADRGFLVFDPAASLVDAFRQYMQRAVDESCGKCAPCRIGTRKLLDELEALQRGRLTDRSLPTILELASLVA